VEKTNWQQSQNTQNKYELHKGTVTLTYSIWYIAPYANALHLLERQDSRYISPLSNTGLCFQEFSHGERRAGGRQQRKMTPICEYLMVMMGFYWLSYKHLAFLDIQQSHSPVAARDTEDTVGGS